MAKCWRNTTINKQTKHENHWYYRLSFDSHLTMPESTTTCWSRPLYLMAVWFWTTKSWCLWVSKLWRSARDYRDQTFIDHMQRQLKLLKVDVPDWKRLHSIGQYTVISWLRGEQSNYCPKVMEKIWETFARGRRLSATVSQIFSTTKGEWFDCSPSSLEITVLLPNYGDARHWHRDMWRCVTSFITWPVNSALLTGQ